MPSIVGPTSPDKYFGRYYLHKMEGVPLYDSLLVLNGDGYILAIFGCSSELVESAFLLVSLPIEGEGCALLYDMLFAAFSQRKGVQLKRHHAVAAVDGQEG